MRKIYIILSSVLAVVSQNALADNNVVLNDESGVAYESAQTSRWGLGLGVAVQSSVYKNYDNDAVIIPLVNYKGDYFYIEGLSAGVYFINDQQHQMFADVTYQGLNFDPDDTSHDQLRRLDKRRSTVMAGLGYNYQDTWGSLRFHVAADILGRSDGLVADARYSYVAYNHNGFFFSPNIGLEWFNGDHNRYYYGVTHWESSRSGLPAYAPSSSWSPYVGFSAGYQLNSNFDLFMHGRLNILSDEVKDSPMVDADYHGVLAIGAKYNF